MLHSSAKLGLPTNKLAYSLTHLLTYCPQEYERKWSKCIVSNGVLKLVFKPDNDEEGLQVDDEAGKDEASHE
tara:strand:- start:195 stop:410 length:216 start_codon:yes stop_codon:yes gene_type:complete